MILRHFAEIRACRNEKVCRRNRPVASAIRSPPIARQSHCRGICRLYDFRRMRRSCMTRRQRLLVILRELRSIQLIDGIAQPLKLIGHIHRPLQIRTPRLQTLKRPPAEIIFGSIDLAVTVERIALKILVHQRSAIVRAMYVHQQIAKRPQRLHRCRRIVYPYAASA